jgi:tetratricopeptide (TPR) repeat protein
MYKIAVAASNELNDQQSVIDWLKKWVTTFPKDNEVFYSLASYNFLFNNLEEALIWYKECLDNNFLIWEVYPKMIEILRKISRPQEAQKLFEEFNRKCELNPE